MIYYEHAIHFHCFYIRSRFRVTVHLEHKFQSGCVELILIDVLLEAITWTFFRSQLLGCQAA